MLCKFPQACGHLLFLFSQEQTVIIIFIFDALLENPQLNLTKTDGNNT
jgi:hypothetical protein